MDYFFKTNTQCCILVIGLVWVDYDVAQKFLECYIDVTCTADRLGFINAGSS